MRGVNSRAVLPVAELFCHGQNSGRTGLGGRYGPVLWQR